MRNHYCLEDFPIVDMKKEGLIKKSLSELSAYDIALLMSGEETSTCFIRSKTHNGALYEYLIRYSLERDKDAAVRLVSNPIIDSVIKDSYFTDNDIYNLSGGFAIGKTLRSNCGLPKKHIYQFSKKTGKLLNMPVSNLKLPNQIGNAGECCMMAMQKELLKFNSLNELHFRDLSLTICIDLDKPGYFHCLFENRGKWEKRKEQFLKYSMPPLFF